MLKMIVLFIIKGKILERKNDKKIEIDNSVLIELKSKNIVIAKTIVNIDGNYEFKISKSSLKDSIVDLYVIQQPLLKSLKCNASVNLK